MYKTDRNQKEIVDALRSCGATVHVTAQVGNGFPDLVCGIFGKNFLIEIKNPEARGKLTAEQIVFRDRWKGKVYVVNSVEEALRVIGVN